ncbi:MAG: ATP-binding protein, partial [Micrococcales bacterium]|nr:ATP-binding protein [Micrococcales bacterium]
RLPVGIQTFAKIREEGSYYVDKTGYAARMVAEGSTYFLSRPRRFGKSLFLDTLAEMFSGNKPLFEGLECYDTWDWDTVYPVVRIDFAERSQRSLEWIDRRIDEIITANEERLGVPATTGTVPARFGALLRNTEAKYGQRVVVLVDEYDKPILDAITEPDLARDVRDRLASLYSVTKSHDAHIKFVMLTGVSKFSKVNLFSGLNNPEDITFSPTYSAVCGYTEDDLDTVFAPELPGLDREQIREWYNGYNWDGEAVYNPYDLLLLFRNRRFKSYWFETATPTFLVETLAQRGAYLPRLADLEASETQLGTFDVGNMSTVALLFQTGYLTIDRERSEPPDVYQLKYPNAEVRKSLAAAVLGYLRPMGEEAAGTGPHALKRLLAEADFDKLRAYVQAMFSGIPYNWHAPGEIERFEGYYASVFYGYFAAAGLTVITEDATSLGRIDMTVLTSTGVFIFEFKVIPPSKPGDALAQIRTKKYADKYRTQGLPIHLVGVEFAREARNVETFEVETVAP